MKWIFQLKSEDKTLKKSAYAADIFYNMSKWRMKKQPSSFLMLCYVCSKIYSDPLNYEREREKKGREGGRLSVTAEVTIEHIFMLMAMAYNELMTLNQTNTVMLRINRIWKWEHANKAKLFLQYNLFCKVIAQ